jgi:hypothetical protein
VLWQADVAERAGEAQSVQQAESERNDPRGAFGPFKDIPTGG